MIFDLIIAIAGFSGIGMLLWHTGTSPCDTATDRHRSRRKR